MQRRGVMEFGIFLIWNCVGDAKFSKTNPLRMAWCFCWQIIKKGLEGCSIVHFDFMEGEELEIF